MRRTKSVGGDLVFCRRYSYSTVRLLTWAQLLSYPSFREELQEPAKPEVRKWPPHLPRTQSVPTSFVYSHGYSALECSRKIALDDYFQTRGVRPDSDPPENQPRARPGFPQHQQDGQDSNLGHGGGLPRRDDGVQTKDCSKSG